MTVRVDVDKRASRMRQDFWVAIDTEFTSLEFMESPDPKALPALLSLGMVTQDGDEFYAELVVSDSLRHLCSDFVKETVLTQFGRTGSQNLSAFELSCKTADFFASLPDPTDVVCEDSVDWQLLSQILDLADPSACARLRMRNVWKDLRSEPESILREKTASFALSSEENLFVHHALADARALQAAVASISRRRGTSPRNW